MSLDYSLCDQTVTLYRLQESGVLRQVIRQAYLQIERSRQTPVTGQEQTVHCHVILPGQDVQLLPGDRILRGEGPELTREQWYTFLPVTVPELVQIEYAKTFYWQGEQCHVEGGA